MAIYMHDAGHTVSIVNPIRIKGFAQSELMRTKEVTSVGNTVPNLRGEETS